MASSGGTGTTTSAPRRHGQSRPPSGPSLLPRPESQREAEDLLAGFLASRASVHIGLETFGRAYFPSDRSAAHDMLGLGISTAPSSASSPPRLRRSNSARQSQDTGSSPRRTRRTSSTRTRLGYLDGPDSVDDDHHRRRSSADSRPAFLGPPVPPVPPLPSPGTLDRFVARSAEAGSPPPAVPPKEPMPVSSRAASPANPPSTCSTPGPPLASSALLPPVSLTNGDGSTSRQTRSTTPSPQAAAATRPSPGGSGASGEGIKSGLKRMGSKLGFGPHLGSPIPSYDANPRGSGGGGIGGGGGGKVKASGGGGATGEGRWDRVRRISVGNALAASRAVIPIDISPSAPGGSGSGSEVKKGAHLLARKDWRPSEESDDRGAVEDLTTFLASGPPSSSSDPRPSLEHDHHHSRTDSATSLGGRKESSGGGLANLAGLARKRSFSNRLRHRRSSSSMMLMTPPQLVATWFDSPSSSSSTAVVPAAPSPSTTTGAIRLPCTILGVRVPNRRGEAFARPLGSCLAAEAVILDEFVPVDVEPGSGRALAELDGLVDGEARRWLPVIVVRCLQYLNKWGMSEEGIYRVPGRSTDVDRLRVLFDAGCDLDLKQYEASFLDPHAVASLFKLWLRELPESLLGDAEPAFNHVMITYAGRPATLASSSFGGGPSTPVLSSDHPAPRSPASAHSPLMGQDDPFTDRLAHLVCHALAPTNWFLLRALAFHLGHLSENAGTNRMTLGNLRLILSPTVRFSTTFLELLVVKRDILFGKVNEQVSRMTASRFNVSRSRVSEDGRELQTPSPAGSTGSRTPIADRFRRTDPIVLDPAPPSPLLAPPSVCSTAKSARSVAEYRPSRRGDGGLFAGGVSRWTDKHELVLQDRTNASSSADRFRRPSRPKVKVLKTDSPSPPTTPAAAASEGRDARVSIPIGWDPASKPHARGRVDSSGSSWKGRASEFPVDASRDSMFSLRTVNGKRFSADMDAFPADAAEVAAAAARAGQDWTPGHHRSRTQSASAGSSSSRGTPTTTRRHRRLSSSAKSTSSSSIGLKNPRWRPFGPSPDGSKRATTETVETSVLSHRSTAHQSPPRLDLPFLYVEAGKEGNNKEGGGRWGSAAALEEWLTAEQRLKLFEA